MSGRMENSWSVKGSHCVRIGEWSERRRKVDRHRDRQRGTPRRMDPWKIFPPVNPKTRSRSGGASASNPTMLYIYVHVHVSVCW